MSDRNAEGRLNSTILDPPRWGWTAAAGVADLLTPHERARRSGTQKAFLRSKRKRAWNESLSESSPIVADNKDNNVDESSQNPLPQNDTSAGPLEHVNPSHTVSDATRKQAPPSSLSDGYEAKPPAQPTVESVTTTATASCSAGTKNQMPTEKRPIRFSALKRTRTQEGATWDAGTEDSRHHLDWYTYHRGRAGLEKREEDTGELLCDVPVATDTNFALDEPTWSTAKVTLRFPLDDKRRRGTSEEEEGRRHIFRDTILWDWLGGNIFTVEADTAGYQSTNSTGLLDKDPLEIAGLIAEEYGLTFCEAMDLAEYIQSQLRTWVREEALYASPLTCIDPMTRQKRDRPNPALLELYGNAISTAEGGLEVKTTTRSTREKSVLRNNPVPRRPSSVEASKKTEASKKVGAASKKMVAASKKVGASKKIPRKTPAPKKEKKRLDIPDNDTLEEVRRRLLLESTKEIKEKASSEETVGVLTVKEGLSCHLCQHSDGIFAQFCCGKENHSFCRSHIRQKVGLPLDGGQVALAYCPICALLCDCDSCTITLEKVAIEFKAQNSSQQCTLQETSFPGLLEAATSNRVHVPNKGKARMRKKPAFGIERTIVPKVPPTDLPREVSEGIDVDPGTDADYAAVYTEKGPVFPAEMSFSVEAANSDQSIKASVVMEDGSVDFCNVCRQHGSLLCCDFCPRAFHSKCIRPSSDVDEQSDGPWECPSCKAEKAGLEGDKVDGTKSLAEITAAYGTKDQNEADEKLLLLLSFIHQMLLRLMDYDFGYIFSEPVDEVQFPEYRKMVQNPMDLGTVSKMLLSGTYMETKGSTTESLECVAIRALQDVELVWKNCFLFNMEGSSVYRMAIVQQRRAAAIRKASFTDLLSANINDALGYDIPANRSSQAVVQPSVIVGTRGITRPKKSRHKITVSRRNHIGHPVAVLDPDTCKIVKIYSTIQAAGAAVVFLLGLGHRCEWQGIETDTVQKVRKIIKVSHSKPLFLLMGYRWLMLDLLRSGDVAFPKSVPGSFPGKDTTRVANSGNDTSYGLGEGHRQNSWDTCKKKDGVVISEFESVACAYEDYVKTVGAQAINNIRMLDQSEFEDRCTKGKVETNGVSYFTHKREGNGSENSETKGSGGAQTGEYVPESTGHVGSVYHNEMNKEGGVEPDNGVYVKNDVSSLPDYDVKGMDQNSGSNTTTELRCLGASLAKRDGLVLSNGTVQSSRELIEKCD